MSETYTVSAKTVDEAIDLASKLYGGKNKEFSHEIVSLPKKGFLGFGSKDAVIRVTVTEAEDVGLSSIVNELKKYKEQPTPETGYSVSEEKPEAKTEPKVAEKPHVQPQQKKKPQQKTDKPAEKPAEKVAEKTSEKPSEKPQKKAEKPVVKAETKVEVKEEKKPQSQQKKKPQQKAEKPAEKPQQKTDKAAEAAAKETKIKSAVSREEMDYAISFVNDMIANMHLSAQAIPVSAPEGEEYTVTETADVYPAINIIGDDTGILIGHHGETLDAIQYLVNLALFRKNTSEKGRDSIKITVDIENYREKREETLRALARRMAARAVKYKRNVFLEPMNPYERRIIHSELQDYRDVAPHSVGSDTNRKIIITYEGTDKAPVNNKRRSRSGKGRQDRASDVNTFAEPDIPKGLPLPTLDDVE